MKRRLVAAVVCVVVLLSLGAGLVSVLSRPDRGIKISRGTGAVAIIPITGTIVSGRATPGFFGSGTGSEDVMERLRQASRDPAVKAVVLRLNSPGGTAAGAQEIAAEVDNLRKSGKKVVASMGDAAASGAYWIASRADKIVANPGSLTGSIGVIMQTQDLRGLYDKLGINTRTFKSGPYKDMGSPSRPVTPEEQDIFQGMVDDIYDQFLRAVSEGRKMELDRVRKLADGRVYTGRQAQKLGLVDELGNLRDAVRLAGRLAGLGPDPVTTELGPRGFWSGILSGTLFPKGFGSAFPDNKTAIWLICPPCLPPGSEGDTLRFPNS
ncbi:signal peptide peptidase SppA [Desulfofundulus thermosubterraneus]|uniref:Protease-4 n=1 Tax=Desulfofundulus thermosubterraneus DSM 16057 TaxID=1121432 RepID=A0A1M6KBX2_9FIRM|nr:signal peptide peptidase SppA [Desulfofundulus thermosubterraneus]SHJ56441.1 protease-4 [Desulfofundulus thermosubterraneus DSM 16057]